MAKKHAQLVLLFESRALRHRAILNHTCDGAFHAQIVRWNLGKEFVHWISHENSQGV